MNNGQLFIYPTAIVDQYFLFIYFIFSTAIFTDLHIPKQPQIMSTCRFKVRAEVEPGLIVYVSGNNSKLGNWNVDHAIELQPLAGTDW